MTKAIVPIVVGAVLGAFATSILLKSDDADSQPNAATTAANPVPLPATGDSEALSNAHVANIAIGELSAITDPAARRNAALTLLDVRGYSAESLDEIAATLPLMEAVNFRIEAIVARGKQDAQGALTFAMLLPDPEQRRLALRRLARSLAEHDPFGAISNINAIESAALESEFMVALLDAWAIMDPEQALAYLETHRDVRIPPAEFAFDLLADRDPERLLRLADGLVAGVRKEAITAAFSSLIERDPLAALSRIGQLAPGPQTSRLANEAARGYGEMDPDEAWRWANETNATADTRLLVLAGIQSVDPAHALDLVLADLTSVESDKRAQMRQRIGTYLYYLRDSATSDDIVFALNRMLSLDGSLEANIQQFIGTWSNDDPEAALDWSLQNLDRIDPDRVLISIGRSLARTNPERVRQALFQLPEEDRVPWVTGVGRTLAEHDLAAAREWAFEFPPGPLRDAALHEYMSSEAYGGSVSVQMFDRFSSVDARYQAASQVVFRLACRGHTALAREVASSQIADPELLAQSERRIELNAHDGANGIQCRMRP